jgi:16S rRNA processing protein RimM
MEHDGFVCIGKIVGVHGIEGAVKVSSFMEAERNFKADDPIRLRRPGGRTETRQVAWMRPHKRQLLLCLKGVENRTLAEPLIGSELFIEKTKLPKPEEGTYYWFDIIGLLVFSAGGVYVGRIESILPTGSNDVYVVRDGKKETLIPALASVIVSVDLAGKRMQVDLPEGL